MTNQNEEPIDANVELQCMMVEFMTMANKMQVDRIPDLEWLNEMIRIVRSRIHSEDTGLLDSIIRVRDCTDALRDACMGMWKEADKLKTLLKSGDLCAMTADELMVEEVSMDEEEEG